MTETTGRVDEKGRARAGSQLQVQHYVNERAGQLSAEVLAALGLDSATHRIEWKSPLAGEKYAEYKDHDFLKAIGMEGAADQLSGFWPRSGPRWDALGLIHGGAQPAVVLVEGKSYPEEMFGSGCTAKDEGSRAKITAALATTKTKLGVPLEKDWMGRLYQYGNRLAHVHFVRETLGRDAYLVNLCFVGDTTTRSTTRETWATALSKAKQEMGFPNGTIPHSCEVLLDAFIPEGQRPSA